MQRWRVFDRLAIERLRAEVKALAERMAKIEKLYEAPRVFPGQKHLRSSTTGRRPAGRARAKRVIHKHDRESMLREIRGSLELLKALGVPINLESQLAEDQREPIPD